MPSYGQGPGYGSDTGLPSHVIPGVRGGVGNPNSATKAHQRGGSLPAFTRTHTGFFGFSLLELLIAFAILITLVTVLTPQLLRYLERSRITHDEANFALVERAVNILLADDEINSLAEVAATDHSTYTLNITYLRDGLVAVSFRSGHGDEVLARALAAYLDVSDTLTLTTDAESDAAAFFTLSPFASRTYREYETIHFLGYMALDGSMSFERQYASPDALQS